MVDSSGENKTIVLLAVFVGLLEMRAHSFFRETQRHTADIVVRWQVTRIKILSVH